MGSAPQRSRRQHDSSLSLQRYTHTHTPRSVGEVWNTGTAVEEKPRARVRGERRSGSVQAVALGGRVVCWGGGMGAILPVSSLTGAGTKNTSRKSESEEEEEEEEEEEDNANPERKNHTSPERKNVKAAHCRAR
ncbi:hypothetical protein P4O66_010391 [Electrophorus voltai]|uniref:Uncharacterized protein n=1 Tax=Electrophorus voltai TaxID=2609070 RepID=A0AAD8Z9M9_9TELE|nr:hypothetical protein P4O66_010391 [Electrophorus voltai]